MIIYYVQVVHVMHYTYTHCGGPPSMPRVHDETGEFSTRYCIQHAHCTSSVFTCVQVCLAVEKKKCLHLGFVRLLHSVGSPFFFFFSLKSPDAQVHAKFMKFPQVLAAALLNLFQVILFYEALNEIISAYPYFCQGCVLQLKAHCIGYVTFVVLVVFVHSTAACNGYHHITKKASIQRWLCYFFCIKTATATELIWNHRWNENHFFYYDFIVKLDEHITVDDEVDRPPFIHSEAPEHYYCVLLFL